MDANIYRLDARLGALELLIRNLYARRFTEETDPVEAATRAATEVERLSKTMRVMSPEPVVNDALAAEAEEFLVAMFDEIVEIVRADARTRSGEPM